MFKFLRRIARGLLPKVTITTRAPDREFILRYVCAVVDPRGVMIDIGAGTGSVPESFIERIGLRPENCVLIEACPDNYRHLADRCPAARTRNYAVADHDGTVPFYVTDDPRWVGSSKSNTLVDGVLDQKYSGNKVTRIEVPARTLSSVFAGEGLDRVEFIMVNCEGAEYFIFRNGIDCLRNTRLVWLEFHGFSRALTKFMDEKRRIFDLFEAAGFTRVAGMRRDEIDESFVHTMVLFERTDWVAG